MKAALINSNGLVENIVMWDDQSIAPQGLDAIVLDDDVSVSIGFVHEGAEIFRDPVPMPPAEETLSPPQPKLTELQAKLLSLQNQIQSLVSQQATPKAS